MRWLKYFGAYLLPALAYISFTSQGFLTYLPLIEAFFLIPILELFIKPSPSNLDQAEERKVLDHVAYDILVYGMVPLQVFLTYTFLTSIGDPTLDMMSLIGRISAMGLLCGVIGINVGHELGHRKKPYERLMAKMLLLSSLYMHFYIEHNRGHHKNVSTHDDPESARFGENLYAFWFRAVWTTYVNAWKLESERLGKKGTSWLSWQNEMLRFQLIHFALMVAIGWWFGVFVLFYFLIACLIGVLLLETVNYVEHYGLSRKKVGDRYEKVQPHHSWNSDHLLGRIVLFELSRHSDHHYKASRKYQILKSHENVPQMPTGYPGMMVLATFPPVWFKKMHKYMREIGVDV